MVDDLDLLEAQISNVNCKFLAGVLNELKVAEIKIVSFSEASMAEDASIDLGTFGDNEYSVQVCLDNTLSFCNWKKSEGLMYELSHGKVRPVIAEIAKVMASHA